jgi:hypothetical protein
VSQVAGGNRHRIQTHSRVTDQASRAADRHRDTRADFVGGGYGSASLSAQLAQ